MAQAKKRLTVGKIIGRVLIVFFTTLLLIIIALYMLMLVIAKGPSNSAKSKFVNTMNETSALKFIPKMYFTQEEIAEYVGSFRDNTTDEVTNADLVTIAPKTVGQPAVDENGKIQPETELVDVSGSTFRGKLLKIKDPSRVTLGVSGQYGDAYEGRLVKDMAAEHGAFAAINAGGFADLNSVGNGGTPLGIVIAQGKLLWGDLNETTDVVGFDKDNRLRAGSMTGKQAMDLGLRDAVSCSPLLISDGKAVEQDASLSNSPNPRTAIGQTADGTVLLLVIEGRQADSLGATYNDLIDIMLQNGAVTAANLGGGSQSHMICNNEMVTASSSLYGPRKLPNCWLVAPES